MAEGEGHGPQGLEVARRIGAGEPPAVDGEGELARLRRQEGVAQAGPGRMDGHGMAGLQAQTMVFEPLRLDHVQLGGRRQRLEGQADPRKQAAPGGGAQQDIGG